MKQSMKNDIKRTISDVAVSLRRGRDRKVPCSVLIGAGCSFSAGIPLASGIEKWIEDNDPGAYRRAQEKTAPEKPTYPYLMGELDTGPRYDLIADYVAKSRLNWAHLLLGYLVDQGYVGRILTTNFDNLTLRALSLYHCFPSVYDLAISTRFKADLVCDPSVFFLHGQHGGFVQLHTQEDVKDHAKDLAPAFEDASLRRTWLVVGYSGDNDPVFENLAGKKFNNALYWVGYRDSEPIPVVQEKLLNREKHAYWVEGYDADSFFYKLCQELQLDLPPFIADPFSHQLSILEQFQPYSEKGEKAGYDLLEKPKNQLRLAKKCLIDNTPECPKESEHQKEEKQLTKNVSNLYFQGRHKEVTEILQAASQPLSDELQEMYAWSLIDLGNKLHEKAKTQQGEEADKLWDEACKKYDAALKIKPDMHEALYNWGNTLSEKAKTRKGKEADKLWDNACEKYKAALKIKPDMHKILNNWGLALYNKSETRKTEEADKLWEEACEKYKAALKIKPDTYKALINWGNALSEKAKTRKGKEADKLWEEVCEKYRAALQIKPDNHETLYNWGLTLNEKAKTRQGEEADKLMDEAYEKYIAALKINPDYYHALYNLGCLFACKGDTEISIEWLEKCRSVSKIFLTQKRIANDEDFDRIRHDPRFEEFVATLPPE